MTTLAQLDLFAPPAPPASPPADTPPAAPTPGDHRYVMNGDGKIVCKHCTVERREAPTGLRSGFRKEWRVLVDGQWRWTTDCPPCLPGEVKKLAARKGRRRNGHVDRAAQVQLPKGEQP